MYIYICYYQTSRRNKGKLANTTRRVEHDAMNMTRSIRRNEHDDYEEDGDEHAADGEDDSK